MRFTSLYAALPALALAAPAPLLEPRAGTKVIPGKYIAVLKSDTVGALSTDSAAQILGTKPDSTVQVGNFKALTFTADSSQLDEIRKKPSVFFFSPMICNLDS